MDNDEIIWIVFMLSHCELFGIHMGTVDFCKGVLLRQR